MTEDAKVYALPILNQATFDYLNSTAPERPLVTTQQKPNAKERKEEIERNAKERQQAIDKAGTDVQNLIHDQGQKMARRAWTNTVGMAALGLIILFVYARDIQMRHDVEKKLKELERN